MEKEEVIVTKVASMQAAYQQFQQDHNQAGHQDGELEQDIWVGQLWNTTAAAPDWIPPNNSSWALSSLERVLTDENGKLLI